MRKESLAPGLTPHGASSCFLPAPRWGARWPSSSRGVDLAVLETLGPFLSSSRMTSCLCSPNLFPDTGTHLPPHHWVLQEALGGRGPRTGWLTGSEGQADVSESRMIFVIGRPSFHWEATGQACHWAGDRAGGDFELRSGGWPPLPCLDHGFPSCMVSVQSLPPHNASLCPEPPGTPVT